MCLLADLWWEFVCDVAQRGWGKTVLPAMTWGKRVLTCFNFKLSLKEFLKQVV